VRGFRDGRIRYWNQGAEDTYGYSRVEALGAVAADLLRTRFPAPAAEIEAGLLASGRWEGELVQTRKDGSRLAVIGRWALQPQESGDHGVLEINRDVTAGRHAEERFRSIFERGPNGIALVDRQLSVIQSNPAFDELFGSPAERPSDVLQLVDPDDRDSLRQACDDLAAGHDRVSLTQRCLRADGSHLWARVTLAVVPDVDGDVRFYIAMIEDTTEQHQYEEALREHGERMAALEREKSEFLNLASHELRGPITLIRGYLSMMEEGYLGELNEIGHQVLPALSKKIEAMNVLIEQMLETARLDEGRILLHFAPADLRQLVEDVVAGVRPLAGDKHQIVLEVPLEEVPVLVDAGSITTIVGNLLDNALKYSPAGGEVLIQVSLLQDEATVQVSDRGIGISRREMHRLFTRFGRVVTPETSSIGGTGLGLYLARELSRRLGGELAAANRAGGGTVVTMTLPLRRDEPGSS
jgi:PAS domain S-box-containing protein